MKATTIGTISYRNHQRNRCSATARATGGIGHPNESRWGIEDGLLVSYHESDEPSTRFTSIGSAGDRMILEYRLVPARLAQLKPRLANEAAITQC